MARIPDAEIERLKAETSLIRLVEAAGIKLTRRGKDMIGLCPFHEEETASLSVNPEKNVFHCFGCGAGGGVIDWVMKKNGVIVPPRRRIAEGRQAGCDGRSGQRSPRASSGRAGCTQRSSKALLNQVVDYYHRCLKTTPDALEYLKARGLNNSELIDTFRLGYANRTLGLRLPKDPQGGS